MRLALGLLAGITLAWCTAAIWKPTLALMFTDEPATHPDCTPRYRTWHNGVMTEGPWE